MNVIRILGFILFLCFTSESYSCERLTAEALKHTVELAFTKKSFSLLGDSIHRDQPITLKVENEYDEEQPISLYHFDELSAMSDWFYDQYQYAASMLIPMRLACDSFGCSYELPRTTLHHGIYLLGFQTKPGKQCVELTSMYIYLA